MLHPKAQPIDMTRGNEVQWSSYVVTENISGIGGIFVAPEYEDQAGFMDELSQGDALNRFIYDLPKLGHPNGGPSGVYDTGRFALKVFDTSDSSRDYLPGSLPELRANAALTYGLEETDARVGPWRLRNIKPVAAFVCLHGLVDKPHFTADSRSSYWLMEKVTPQLYIEPRVGMPRYVDMEAKANEALQRFGFGGDTVGRHNQENLIMTERPSGLFSRKPGTIFLTGVRAYKLT